MQFHRDYYNNAIHEMRKALTVKNPYAEQIASGLKTIEVRSKNTSYRGSLVICSSQLPVMPGYMSGCTLATVDLVAVKSLKDFTPEDWEKTCIPEEQQAGLTGYGWILENPKRLIEYPTTGYLGIWNLVRNKGEFGEYPNQEAIQTLVNQERYNAGDMPAIPQAPAIDNKYAYIGCIILSGMIIGAFTAIYLAYSLFKPKLAQ